MRRLLSLALASALGWSGLAIAADNIALVIGNGTYANAPEAQTAERDARAVSDALQSAGWEVSVGLDLDRAGMKAVIAEFAAKVPEAERLAIFYSGHALRSSGITYLAPVDAQAGTLTDVLFDGVALDLLLQIAGNKPGNAVMFVDGAQLRGFTPTEFVEPGLAALEGPEGVLIVSAAPPGRAVRRSRWRDSRFARLIVDRFVQPGASMMTIVSELEQPTFVVGSVDQDFTLSPMPDPVRSGGLDAEIELAYWRAAERSGKAEDYRAYLDRFPNGIFADFARERLGLGADGTPQPQEPEIDPRILEDRALNLSRIRKRKLQEYLYALGFDPKGIDGLFGRGSRNAIRRWQQKNGIMDGDGWLTEDQVALMSRQGEAALEAKRLREAEARRIREAEDNAYWSATGANATAQGYRLYLKKYPEGLHSKVARAALDKMAEAAKDDAARRERRAFRRAKRQDTAAAYRDYLGAYPEGIYRDQALARLDEIEGAERAAAQASRLEKRENGLGLTVADRLSIEQRLRVIGYEVGPLDGTFDNRTRAAIRGYQNARGLNPTGYLNRRTVVTLVRDTSRRGGGEEGQVIIDGTEVIRGLIDALGNK